MGGGRGVTYIFDAFLQSLRGQSTGTLHGDTVVVGAPAGGVDVDVGVVKAESPGLHAVRHFPVQHAHTWRSGRR